MTPPRTQYAPALSRPRRETLHRLARTLESGASADIFYYASHFGDDAAAHRISNVQDAMTRGAEVLRAVAATRTETLANAAEIAAARAQHGNDVLEVDEGAAASRGENGVWVQAWVFIGDAVYAARVVARRGWRARIDGSNQEAPPMPRTATSLKSSKSTRSRRRPVRVAIEPDHHAYFTVAGDVTIPLGATVNASGSGIVLPDGRTVKVWFQFEIQGGPEGERNLTTDEAVALGFDVHTHQALYDATAVALLATARVEEPEAARAIEAAPQFSAQTVEILSRVMDLSVHITERPVLAA